MGDAAPAPRLANAAAPGGGALVLNLGCGKRRIPGSIGVDRVALEGFVDVVHDLEQVPYPFASDSADEIHLYYVLEHLHEPLRIMEELHRIMKPGAKLYIKVPHFSSAYSYIDITHVRPYSFRSFNAFERGNPIHYYTRARFTVRLARIKYFGLQPTPGFHGEYAGLTGEYRSLAWLMRLLPPVEGAMNFLINLSPALFERFWCYLVGGAMEVWAILEKEGPEHPERRAGP